MNADRPDPSRPEDPDHGLDFDAAFADIVARLGPLEPDEQREEPREEPDRDQPDDPVTPPAPGPAPAPGPEPGPQPTPPPGPQAGTEAAPAGTGADAPAGWDDEGHFVPPEPPPLPTLDPRRRVAWVALLGSPVLAFLLAIVGSGFPGWVGLLLAVAFVGGFGYLVATMRSSPPDDWSDDGARL